MMPQASIRIGSAELSAFVGAIFEAVGLSKQHAAEWARMLVWANLRQPLWVSQAIGRIRPMQRASSVSLGLRSNLPFGQSTIGR